MMPNTGSSVVSSPMKIGLRVREWRMLHQFAHRIGLVDAGRLDLDDELAGQDFDRARRDFGANLVDGGAHRSRLVGRQPIMQGERIALVLGENARPEFGHGGELAFQGAAQRWRADGRFGAGGDAQLGAVAADRGKLAAAKK